MLNPLNKWSYQDSDTGNDVSKKDVFDEQISAPSFACGLKSDHTLWCWGYPIAGLRPPPLLAHHEGSGSVDLSWDEISTPSQVGTAADWVALDAGPKSLCGIRDADKDESTLDDRTLWCAGLHWDGIVYGDAFQVGTASNWQDITIGQAEIFVVPAILQTKTIQTRPSSKTVSSVPGR